MRLHALRGFHLPLPWGTPPSPDSVVGPVAGGPPHMARWWPTRGQGPLPQIRSGVVGNLKPRCNDIHHPSLRLMHKWLAISLFPGDDVRPIRNDELKILYSMINKTKVSPVKPMITQWLDNFLRCLIPLIAPR